MVITCHLRGCVPFFYPDVQRYPIKQGFAVLQPPRTLKIIHRLLIVWFDRNKKTPNVYTTKSPLYHVRCTIACLGQVATAPSQTASERESFGSGCRSATTSARSKMTDLQRVGEVFTIVARWRLWRSFWLSWTDVRFRVASQSFAGGKSFRCAGIVLYVFLQFAQLCLNLFFSLIYIFILYKFFFLNYSQTTDTHKTKKKSVRLLLNSSYFAVIEQKNKVLISQPNFRRFKNNTKPLLTKNFMNYKCFQ